MATVTRQKTAVDPEQALRALGSLDRLAILSVFVNDGVASAVQASRMLELPLANVAYHVRGLVNGGALARRPGRAGYRTARGAIENIYDVTDLGRVMLGAARSILDEVRGVH